MLKRNDERVGRNCEVSFAFFDMLRFWKYAIYTFFAVYLVKEREIKFNLYYKVK
jgi:hypothetical protein